MTVFRTSLRQFKQQFFRRLFHVNEFLKGRIKKVSQRHSSIEYHIMYMTPSTEATPVCMHMASIRHPLPPLSTSLKNVLLLCFRGVYQTLWCTVNIVNCDAGHGGEGSDGSFLGRCTYVHLPPGTVPLSADTTALPSVTCCIVSPDFYHKHCSAVTPFTVSLLSSFE